MKYLSLVLLVAAGAMAGCSTTANNGATNNANLRGANTNTGYTTNTDATAKPTIPANSTVIAPDSPLNQNRPSGKPMETPKSTNVNK